MNHRNRAIVILAALAAVLPLATPGWPATITKQLSPGVTFTQDISTDPQASLITNIVTIDPSAPGVALKAAIGQDVVITNDWRKGREFISSITARKGALVGVNAGYFSTGDPLGTCIVDSQIISEPFPNRVTLAVTRSKSMFIDVPRLDASVTFANGVTRQIDGINRTRDTNQLIAYTDIFGATTQNKYKATDVICTSPDLPIQPGKTINLTVTEVKLDALNTPIPKGGVVFSAGGPAGYFLKENLKPGDTFTARFDIKSAANCDWTQVEHAWGGGPWLVKQGCVAVDAVEQGFEARFASGRNPRTAAGLTADGKLLLVTVDGRQSISGGISLPDLANLMLKLGAVNAMNFDGGGSTTLSIRGLIVNSLSEGEERLIADALLVFAQPQPGQNLPKLAIAGLGAEAISGQPVQLSLVSGDDAKPVTPEQSANVVWGTTNGIGFVNQMGYFIPMSLRKGTVGVTDGAQTASISVAVVPGLPARLDAKLTPDKLDPNRTTLSVTVYDANSNRLPGKEVLLNVAGGKPDAESGMTNEKGEFTTVITWDPAATDRVAVALAGNITTEARPLACQ